MPHMVAPVFVHGVASGDPGPDGVVLWTRVSVPSLDPVAVRWQVATDPDLESVVAEGTTEAGPQHDFTVHVDVRGLRPSATYYYRFETATHPSPVGRTRTAPSGKTERLRLGVVSCACWPHGFFNVYRCLADRNVDLVLHLGDYIYEHGEGWEEGGRIHEPPRRLRTLADYRARHAQYRADADLQRLHQRHPVVAVWDDHDVAGNAWRHGAADHDSEQDGDWPARREAATRAYLEWLPVRSPDGPDRIYRSFDLGDLAQLIVLDTRLAGRERPVADGERPVAMVDPQNRSLLGPEQRAWLRATLVASSRRWQLLANQVMMAPLRLVDVPRSLRWIARGLIAGGAGVNAGQWDGYPAERASLFDLVEEAGIRNLVVLSGDLHSSWAGELTVDPGEEARVVGVEFVTPSVTSRSFAHELAPSWPGARAALRRLVASQNPHFRFVDLEQHGYLVVDVDGDRLQAEFWHVDTVARRESKERLAAVGVVRDGDNRLFVTGDGRHQIVRG